MPPESIRVRCPQCGKVDEDWWRPSVNLDLDDFDPAYVEQCSTANCPTCDLTVALGTLIVKDGVLQLQASEAETAVSRAPRLFEVAYACRLYAEFTGYDEAIETLRNETAPGVDLGKPTHRRALLRWLNAWGCRQFAIECHPVASRSLEKWARRCLELLPPPTASLHELVAEEIGSAVQAYEQLMQARAGTRRRGPKEYVVTFGPTGAAKTLYALRPEVFPPWDEAIQEALGLDDSAESYRAFLELVQPVIRSLIEDAQQHGIDPRDIPKMVGRPESSLPKLLDEFYWVTITKGVSLPTATEIATWHGWSQPQ